MYRLYREEAIRQGIPPVGERTFYRERAAFEDGSVVARRRGKRAAYALEPRLSYLDQTTPRHGERPFERAHLDHTQLDLMLVSSVTGKPFAKPWVSFLTDVYSSWSAFSIAFAAGNPIIPRMHRSSISPVLKHRRV